MYPRTDIFVVNGTWYPGALLSSGKAAGKHILDAVVHACQFYDRLFDSRRRATLRNMHNIIIAILVIIAAMCTARSCEATEYSIGALTLSRPVPNKSMADYTCVPREEFDNTILCSPNRKVASRTINISSILVDAPSSSILYVYEKYTRTDTVDRVEKSVMPEISSSLGGLTAKRFSADNAVVLVWGEVRLEAVSPNATEYDQYDPSKGAIDRQLGLLVNAVGDFKAAKDASRPLFRVIGGDGLLVLISEPTPRRVVVQQLIVAAGLLAEKKFKSQARDVLARDQNASATDPSKWPEMAFATRRLALDTTEKNANKVVDEFFASALSQKYRSHVWAYLPTSVIKHLASGTYLSVDTFGPNTEFPYVREQIVAELKRAPAEPYSEFLLYTLGRFDDAVRFSKNSPIHTSLTYASAHSKLRQVMAALFLRAATPADPTMLSFETKSYVEELNPENVQFQSVETITAFQEAKKKIDEDRAKLSDADDKLNGEQSAPPANRDFFHGHAYETIVTSENFYRDSQPSLTSILTISMSFQNGMICALLSKNIRTSRH